jgi:LPS sulfotransferase NodH
VTAGPAKLLAKGVSAPRRAALARLGFRLVGAEPRFVIVTSGRTGSELLVSLLSSHPKIVCEGEIMSLPRAAPSAALLQRSLRARRRGQAYGFKLLPDHARLQQRADPAGYIRGLHDKGFRIVHLERRDWLNQAVSVLRALSSQFHFRRGDRAVVAPLRVDPIAVLSVLWMIEDRVRFLRSAVANLPTLELVYEDDLETEERQARTVVRVCEYLGLAPAPAETELVKLTPRSAIEQLENFDEVAALLGATRFAWLLPADRRTADPSPNGSIGGVAQEPGTSLDFTAPLDPPSMPAP